METKRKEYLMKTIRMINNASPMSMRIIRSHGLCNIKLIERSAKSIKDPNPLGSTLSTMNLKYPLIIDSEKAKEFKIPTKFLAHRDGKPIEDSHSHGKILCRKEALDWWIDESCVPDEETISVIDTLFKHCRSQVKRYYDINWNVRIRLGQVNHERRVVQTNETPATFSKSAREKILEYIFFSDLVIRYEHFPDTWVNKIREVIGQTISCKLSLPSQIRIILSQLDPKMKMLPVVPGLFESCSDIKHAFEGSNYVLSGMAPKVNNEDVVFKRIVKNLSRCIVLKLKEKKAGMDDILNCIKNTKIGDVNLHKVIHENINGETIEMKVLRTCLNLPIEVETENDGLITSPSAKRITPFIKETTSGVAYKIYLGNENVNFKFKDLRGQFVHDGDNIIKIVSNFTNVKEMEALLVEIGVYCRYSFALCTKRNYSDCKQEARMIIRKSFDDFLGIPKGCFRKYILRSPPFKLGKLEIMISTEYKPSGSMNAIITSDGCNLQNTSTRQILIVPTPDTRGLTLPPSVESKSLLLLDFLPLKQCLRTLMDYYMQNYNVLVHKIQMLDFQWKNECFVRFLRTKATGFSFTSRAIVKQLLAMEVTSRLVCFWYCFCFCIPVSYTVPLTVVTLSTGEIIDSKASKGILMYNEQMKSYTLFNIELKKMNRLKYQDITVGFLSGYRILDFDEKVKVFLSITNLERTMEQRRDGDTFNTFVGGEKMTVVRDRSVSHSVVETIRRQISAKQVSMAAQQYDLSFLGKRKAIEPIQGSSGLQNIKRFKREEIINQSSEDDSEEETYQEDVVDEIE